MSINLKNEKEFNYGLYLITLFVYGVYSVLETIRYCIYDSINIKNEQLILLIFSILYFVLLGITIIIYKHVKDDININKQNITIPNERFDNNYNDIIKEEDDER